MSFATRETCGRCGVYQRLHPVQRCKGFRTSWWWDRHSLLEHVGAWLWIHALTRRARWAICNRLAGDKRDWCGLVDAAIYADDWNDRDNGVYVSHGRKHDYRGEYGCLCDFPTPWRVGAPRYGSCYCTPAGVAA